MKIYLIILLVLVSCTKTPNKINITYVKPAPNAPIILGNKKGFVQDIFNKRNIQVQYHDITSGYEQIQAINRGEIDISGVSSGTTALALIAREVDATIVGYFARAPKLFSVMTFDPLISISNLKGKKIAAPRGTGLQQLLDAILKSQALTWDDIEYFPQNLEESYQSLMDREVDVALIAGIYAVNAELAGAIMITNGEGFFDGAMVVVANKTFATKYPELVRDYLKAQEQSIEYLQEHPEESHKIVSQETGIPIDKVESMMPYYDFRQEITEEDLSNLTELQEFLYEQEFITDKQAIENYILKLY
ncbi:MAG: ABC transporter substrate-binding protein [Brevinema sp.]